MNTRRKLTDIRIRFYSESDWETATSIIKKFSATIKSLSFSEYVMELPLFFEIMSFVPMLEYLFLDIYSFALYNTNCLLPEELHLHHMKTLKVKNLGKSFLDVFNRLPAGVLTELEFPSTYLVALHVLLKRQPNVKKLKLNFGTSHVKIHPEQVRIKSLSFQLKKKLEKLQENEYLDDETSIVSRQVESKSLRLCIIDVVVNQLPELERLVINVSRTSVAEFMNIEKLRKLQDLTLLTDSRNCVLIKSFAKFDNSSLRILNLENFRFRSMNLMSALAKSVPNLKVLRLHSDIDHETLDQIQINFNFVEILELTGNTDVRWIITTNENDCFNPKLIEFAINLELISGEKMFLKKLMVAYPNLKKLTFRSPTEFTVSNLKRILIGFCKLESLDLVHRQSELSEGVLDCLENYAKNLKFFSLSDCKFRLTNKHKKKLGAMFDVVSMDSERLMLAVGREAMSRGKESRMRSSSDSITQ